MSNAFERQNRDASDQSGLTTRRTFIKGVAALGATAALQTGYGLERASAEQTAGEEQLFAGVCRGNCAGGCFLNVHVRDGQVVRTTARDMPDTRYNRICSKGLTHVGRIYSSRRLRYPMRRVGERGSGEFERITWEEALDEIASKWQGYTDEFGPAAMAVQYGSGNYAICSGVGLGGAVTRFMNATGCAYIPNNVDAAHGHTASAICTFGLYGAQNEPADFVNADTFVCWGANPSVSQPQVMHFILDAKERGATYVVIDTMFNANAAKADKFIAVNPSTDGVLAFGILNLLFQNGTVDEEFVRNHTNAPFLIDKDTGMMLRMSDFGVAPAGEDADDPYAVFCEDAQKVVAVQDATHPAISGVAQVEGHDVGTAYDNLVRIASDYPLERVAQITGVSAEDVEWLANEYATKDKVNTYAMFGDTNVQPSEEYQNSCGEWFSDYVEAVRQAGSVWSVPVIDLYAVSGIYPLLESNSQYLNNAQTDRLHLNPKGHSRLGATLVYQLLTLPCTF